MICGPTGRSWMPPPPNCPSCRCASERSWPVRTRWSKTCWRPVTESSPPLSIGLRGRIEFQVKGRYVKDAVPGEDKQAVQDRREEDTRALRQAMERLCVASVVREPAHELDAVHVAFLVAADQ